MYSSEFDTTIEAAATILRNNTTELPEARRLHLLGLLENAFLPNISSDRECLKLTTPKSIELGRVALLPVPRFGRVKYDATGVLDRFDPAALPDEFMEALEQRRQSSSSITGILRMKQNGVTRTGRFLYGDDAVQGGTLVIVRAMKNLGRRTSTSIHELTHAALHQGDPNLLARVTDKEAGRYLDAQEEIEAYTTEAKLASLTGACAADEMGEVTRWRRRQYDYMPAADLDMRPFIYE